MLRHGLPLLTATLLGVLPVEASQEGGSAHPSAPGQSPQQKQVQDAIKKGMQFLKGVETPADPRGIRADELLLWTYIHAGVSTSEAKFQELFKEMMTSELTYTYRVSLQAMILEELDRVKYQWRIAQCAQFLVDNQCKNGQWPYGERTDSLKGVPSGDARLPVASGPKESVRTFDESDTKRRSKPKVTRKVTLRKMKDGPEKGDNSNSQYAALGLRACHDAGIVLPKDLLTAARTWWTQGQLADGGWSYSGDGAPAAGSYGSMTAGACGSVVIYDYMLGVDWKKNKSVNDGLAWMAEHFSVTDNPGLPPGDGKTPRAAFYYIYAVERLGILFATDKFGEHSWYTSGAKVLLAVQRADGSWSEQEADSEAFRVANTCFAILFLKRATPPLVDVASVDRFFPKK